MIELAQRAALLDVEGTTSSVAYVYDVMFPFARRELQPYVAQHWESAALDPVRERFAKEAGAASYTEWVTGREPQQTLIDQAVRLMDADVKATGLKLLQGLIWEAGFCSGELHAHLFEEVAPALHAWRAAGVDLRIYSSGSVHAQRLFFGHTEAGDLRPLLTGHYDTTVGPKREADSYAAIAADWRLAPQAIAFFSDVTEELEAARAAGLATVLVNRPGNAIPTPTTTPHPKITSFDEVVWRPSES
ncbi:acireductone synthase [Botrimarina hoheduenensis]|uniref:Enolase-phosphatase E1 n=1 Tax=Botrimarina hoheduenensis TaxID=2528000 RepID=A0A5C5VYQ7_9BACT|nr:acireductone synthase [Botrimarina hoheduenensis]TWT42881.1 Enolase-phosphatase E1 [Botrimarina hoheduenensis]